MSDSKEVRSAKCEVRSEGMDERLGAALQADLPPAPDARFRLDVLERIERARFRRRVALTAAGAAIVALLAAASLPAVESWMAADVHRAWIALGATAVLSTLAGLLLAWPSAARAGLNALRAYV